MACPRNWSAFLTPARECPNSSETAGNVPLCCAWPKRPGRLDGLMINPWPKCGRSWCPFPSFVRDYRRACRRLTAVDLARKFILDDRMPACLAAGVDIFGRLNRVIWRDTGPDQSQLRRFHPGRSGCGRVGPAGTTAAVELQCVAIGFDTEGDHQLGRASPADGLPKRFADCFMTAACRSMTQISPHRLQWRTVRFKNGWPFSDRPKAQVAY